ncbi:hypothetical protein [Promicromonospora sp. NPDC057488]|uniref:hypothetical protein n=1 Tax=Promicromonospora sp. NPDC057488 TaxID=3346147 RepID=UPI00366CAD64
MGVEELLARAWAAVEKAGIPEPLHEYAFKEALARLDGSTSVESQSTQDGSPNPAGTKPAPTEEAPADLSDPFAKFAHESGVPVEDLERTFFFTEDGLPHLNGPRAKFARNAADQAKVVAVAITAAYNFVLDQKTVPDEVIKTEAARLKIDIGGNWARAMTKLQGASWVGQARQKQFKTTSTTADSLQNIVKKILGAPIE